MAQACQAYSMRWRARHKVGSVALPVAVDKRGRAVAIEKPLAIRQRQARASRLGKLASKAKLDGS